MSRQVVYDPFRGFRGEVAVCSQVLSDYIGGSSCLLLDFKELLDIGATPLDKAFELGKVEYVPLLDPRQSIERDSYGKSGFSEADPSTASLGKNKTAYCTKAMRLNIRGELPAPREAPD